MISTHMEGWLRALRYDDVAALAAMGGDLKQRIDLVAERCIHDRATNCLRYLLHNFRQEMQRISTSVFCPLYLLAEGHPPRYRHTWVKDERLIVDMLIAFGIDINTRINRLTVLEDIIAAVHYGEARQDDVEHLMYVIISHDPRVKSNNKKVARIKERRKDALERRQKARLVLVHCLQRTGCGKDVARYVAQQGELASRYAWIDWCKPTPSFIK